MCFTATKQTQKVKIRIVKDMNENPDLEDNRTNEGDDSGIWQFGLLCFEKLKMVLVHSPELKLSRYHCNT